MIALNILHRLIIITFFFRWLSLADSTQALSGCIPSIIGALYEASAERTAEGRALLHGVATDMATYKFIHLTHFLSDAVGLLQSSANPCR